MYVCISLSLYIYIYIHICEYRCIAEPSIGVAVNKKPCEYGCKTSTSTSK